MILAAATPPSTTIATRLPHADDTYTVDNSFVSSPSYVSQAPSQMVEEKKNAATEYVMTPVLKL
jgi:hypothetical protein